IVVMVFVFLAVFIGRRRGALSLAGLGVAGAILLLFTAPQLLAGKNALAVTLVSAGLIAVVTMFIAHGYNLRTRLAVISTLVALLAAIVLSYCFVWVAQLFGLGQGDAFALQAGFLGNIDLRGLLLGGLIISLLGILDDVTTTQTATVEELSKAKPDINRQELFAAAMSVGREHIASLINTLILVYVGASLPLFLLIVTASEQPLWVLLNSEYMAEEIVRAISGSVALILAVPIATAIAVQSYYKKNNTP
ncbi:MAG TPA: YibE/F family protein, partial [Candidatus Doudnabacteria bacterium]|nr:YibE/F family protein [Candidatus Doudnabacteria bacterium]